MARGRHIHYRPFLYIDFSVEFWPWIHFCMHMGRGRWNSNLLVINLLCTFYVSFSLEILNWFVVCTSLILLSRSVRDAKKSGLSSKIDLQMLTRNTSHNSGRANYYSIIGCILVLITFDPPFCTGTMLEDHFSYIWCASGLLAGIPFTS